MFDDDGHLDGTIQIAQGDFAARSRHYCYSRTRYPAARLTVPLFNQLRIMNLLLARMDSLIEKVERG